MYDCRASKGKFFSWQFCYPLSRVNEFVTSRGLVKVYIGSFYLTLPPVEWGLIYPKMNACYEHLQILVSLIHLHIIQIATHMLFLILIVCVLWWRLDSSSNNKPFLSLLVSRLLFVLGKGIEVEMGVGERELRKLLIYNKLKARLLSIQRKCFPGTF